MPAAPVFDPAPAAAGAAKLAVAAAAVSPSLPSEGAGRLVPWFDGGVVAVLVLGLFRAVGAWLLSSAPCDSGLTVGAPVSRCSATTSSG